MPGADAAGPVAGDVVVDVGCGTGNAALLAAERGARAIGVDPAARLLDVARTEARARGLDVAFELGDAAHLSLDGGVADGVLSAFGVIFAPDPDAAAREMARVTAPGGRIVISAWIPEGAISASTRVAVEAVGRALGTPAGRPPFAWHDRDALTALFAPYGFGAVSLSEARIAFTARSAAHYVDRDAEHHPLAISGYAVLGPSGEASAVRDRMIAILDEANEDPRSFRVTSRYVIAIARRRAAQL